MELCALPGESLDEYLTRLEAFIAACKVAKLPKPRLPYQIRWRLWQRKQERSVALKAKREAAKLLPGAGSREMPKGGTSKYSYTENGKIKFAGNTPGKYGGRNSTYRARDSRAKDLQEAGDDGTCHICKVEILKDKAKVLCADPQPNERRRYIAVICKSCCMCEDLKEIIGPDVWPVLKKFRNGRIRAWIRFKFATLPEEKLDKFRHYVLKLDWGIKPR